MKKVFIIHGWGGSPDEPLHQWLASELRKAGFEVAVPAMPDTDEPKMETWIPFLNNLVGIPDQNTFFIGHSIGCQAILRFMESLPEGAKIGGAVFVAGWFDLTEETWDETYTREIAYPWINTPIDFEKLKRICSNFVIIASDNDPYVSLENSERFKKVLGAKVVIEKGKGHISGEDGITELPSALEAVLELG